MSQSTPLMITLETNKRMGHGFQLLIHMDNHEVLCDSAAYSMLQAISFASSLIQDFNQEFDTAYDLQEVVVVRRDALIANRDDLMSRRMLNRIEMDEEINTPDHEPEHREDENGDDWVSERGALVFAYGTWFDDGQPEDKRMQLLRGYCRLLASKGYGGSATQIFEQLQLMDDNEGMCWCRNTYDGYVCAEEIWGLFSNL